MSWANDDFTGNDFDPPDPLKWEIVVPDPYIYQNRLRVRTAATYAEKVIATSFIRGDFDVVVDYVEEDLQTANSFYFYIEIRLIGDDANRANIGRWSDGTNNGYRWATRVADVQLGGTAYPADDAFGKFRIERVGNTWNLYYNPLNTGWILAYTRDIGNADCDIILGSFNWGNNPTRVIYFDNFTIQSGQVLIEDSLTEQMRIQDSKNGFSLIDEITSIAGISDTFETLFFDDEILENFGINGLSESQWNAFSNLVNTAGLSGLVTAGIEDHDEIDSQFGVNDFSDAFNLTRWLAKNKDKAIIKYYFVLTGFENDLADIMIPISSFQSRKDRFEDTYLSVVIPGEDYIDEINARVDGQLIVYMSFEVADGESLTEEISRADLNEIRLDVGSRSQAITLSGYQSKNYGGKPITLKNSTYRNVTGEEITHRFAIPDLYLQPDDILTVGIDTLRVDRVIYTVSSTFSSMEVQGT